MLSDFSVVANTIAGTTRKSEKERLLADYLVGLDDGSLERAVVFFSGTPFPRKDQRVTGVGGSILADAVLAVSGRSGEEFSHAWSHHGDLGDVAASLFATFPGTPVTLLELGEFFDRLAATNGSNEKRAVVAELLSRLDAASVRYVVKILQNEFRIGLQEGLVEAAIARAFGRPLADVRRANMLTGDIGAAALLARGDALSSARMNLFHPFAFMLAQPEEDPAAIVAALGPEALADDKYDGIRAQVHSDGARVAIYSRTLDDITARFPEVATAALALGRPVVLDGEIVAFDRRILPFAVIQKRLGRRKITEALLRDAPVVFFAFDLLFAGEAVLLETPLRERLNQLSALLADAPGTAAAIRASDQSRVRDAAHVDELFDQARARANEGLVIKDPDSTYTPGRRGKSWLKYKKALATLDCVVTAAEYGHGKRKGVLSDYTFAVRRDRELLNIGKAYSGLTDAEIERLTAHFQATTTARYGPVHQVEPSVVLEIAFDRIQESSRHKSGYALRFPRIARIRDDKSVEEISSIDDVRRIYEGQLVREGPPTRRTRDPAAERRPVPLPGASICYPPALMPTVEQPTFVSDPAKQLVLEHGFRFGEGTTLAPFSIQYETFGTLNADRSNAILVCHALSASAHAAGKASPDDEKAGWWDGLIGYGKGIDLDRYFVICANIPGSCFGTTSPSSIDPAKGKPYGSHYPWPAIEDMVHSQKLLLDSLGIERLRCVAGGSLGGMQVLMWAALYPEMMDSIISMAAGAAVPVQGIAWHIIGRKMIESDLRFRGGDYYDEPEPLRGLQVARMVGHMTYLSARALQTKFARRRRGSTRQFEIDSYFEYQGKKFAAQYDANSYIRVQAAMDEMDLEEQYGSLETAFARWKGRTLLISFDTDWLFPVDEVGRVEAAMKANGTPVDHQRIASPNGHDTFLIDYDLITPPVREFLG